MREYLNVVWICDVICDNWYSRKSGISIHEMIINTNFHPSFLTYNLNNYFKLFTDELHSIPFISKIVYISFVRFRMTKSCGFAINIGYLPFP